ncbi:MAG: radical SAM protein, partial [Pseudomonadota bacterium]
VLEVLARCRHPVTIVTKSAAILRDLDLLAPMAADGLFMVGISVTSLDPALARKLEPRAAAPHRRLQVIDQLNSAGIPVIAMVAPMIPGLNDHELESILEAAAEAGARSATYVLLRLPHEIKALFEDWLQVHAPLRARHVLSLVRSCRGGRLNDSTFGKRMRGDGQYAKLLASRFAVARRRYGLDPVERTLRTDLFEAPGRDLRQLRLI